VGLARDHGRYRLVGLPVPVHQLFHIRIPACRNDARQARAEHLYCIVGRPGLLGGLLTIILGQPKYFGMGVPGGILISIIGYLFIFAIFFYNREETIALSQQDRILFAALLAGSGCALHRDPLWDRHRVNSHVVLGFCRNVSRGRLWVAAGRRAYIRSCARHVCLPASTPCAVNVPRHKKRRAVARPQERPTSAAPVIPAWVGSVVGYALIAGRHSFHTLLRICHQRRAAE